MSGLENLTLDNLGVSFLDLDTFEKENENGIEFGDTVGVFGPSKAQLKSYAGWENTDGKFYLPYNKRQNIGKISDFVSAAIMANIMEEREKEKNEMQKKVELEKKEAKLKAKIAKYSKYDEGGKGSLAAEEGEALEDDDGFVTIEDKETKARNTNQKSWTHNNQQQNWRGRGGWNNRGGRGGAYTQNERSGVPGQHAKLLKSTKKAQRLQAYWQSTQVRPLRCNLRDNSIDVKPEWQLLEEITKQSMDRLPMLRPVFLRNAAVCGELSAYDESWDRVSAKKPKAVKPFSGTTFEEPIWDDQTMIDLMQEGVADIYTTDVIVAAIMCAAKSNYSWDIEIKKFGSQIFIDKRQDDDIENNILNYQTVGETALEHQPNDDKTINGIKALMREAKGISESFLHYALDSDVTKQKQLDQENPFIEDEDQVCTRVGYYYKVWKIQEADEKTGKPEKKVCIRCQVHCHNNVKKNEEDFETMQIYTFNEFNTNMTNWKNTIDTALITCLNKEIHNNSFKASRWLIQAMLADVDHIKFAFVSRKDMPDNTKHQVLATHTIRTKNWAKQLNLNLDEMWKNLKFIVDTVEKESAAFKAHQAESALTEKKEGEDGEEDADEDQDHSEYILLKDFNKLVLRLFKKDLQEEEDDEEEGAEEEKN